MRVCRATPAPHTHAAEPALRACGRRFAHQGIVTLFVTKMPAGFEGRSYDKRGWTGFERCSAELIKPNMAYVVEEGKTVDQGRWLWPMCIDTSHAGGAGAGRRPPVAPRRFEAMLASKQFTNQADSGSVAALFDKTATAVLGATTKLTLNDMRLGEGDGAAIAEALQLCGSVTELVLTGTQLPAAEVGAMFALGAPQSLRELHMSGMRLGEAGGVALATAIGEGKVPGLQLLSVDNNQLGEAGGVALAKAIGEGKVPGLQVLSVENNQLGEAGGVALAKAIGEGKVPGLQVLVVDNNQLGEAGGVALGKAIGEGKVPGLQKLGVDNNQLGEAGGVALATAIDDGRVPGLQKLWVGNNELGAARSVLREAAEKRGVKLVD